MASFYHQILTILTTSPGNIAYHLVIAFSVAWAFQGALTLWRAQPSPPARRLLMGLGILLGLRLLLFGGALVTSQGWMDSSVGLPALDRLITTLGALVIAWLWIYPEPDRRMDTVVGFSALFIGVVFLLNLAWGGDTTLPYNESGFDLAWEVLALSVLVTGSFLLIVRRPNQWGTGLGMLALGVAGHLAHLVSPLPGSDLPGAVRVAQMASYPLLITLSQRFISQAPEEPHKAAQIREEMTAAWEDWLTLQNDLPAEKRYRLLARSLAQILKADAVGILLPSGDDAWQIACSYQRETDAFETGGHLSTGDIPILHNALQRKRPLRLPASSTSIDLHTLWERLKVPNGHLLSAPVLTPENTVQMGLVLLSRGQSWSQASQLLLMKSGQAIGRQQIREEHLRAVESSLQKARADLEASRKRQREMEASQKRLKEEIAVLKAGAASRQEAQQPPENLQALLEAQETAQAVIRQLQEENQNLKEHLAKLRSRPPDNGQVSQLERELRSALSEVARLQQLISEADRRALLAQKSEPVTNEQRQALTTLAQELRQPMSSILGYTDLLLGESVGILGALQRKFLERIRASIERMGALIEDLIQIVTVGKPPQALVQPNVPLSRVVDKALAAAGPLMREKNIALRLDLPQDLPAITTDQEALQQALFHLLQNATLATPEEGEVTFRIHLEREENHETGFALVQVSDQGGGIHPDDLPRVFSRLYRSENTPIPGLGDNSTGLAIAKTLIESQGGRVWVDTQEGIGATFSVLLPLAGEQAHTSA